MPEYEIRDIALAPSGHTKIRWVKNNMPLLAGLEEKFLKEKPFEGVKISLSVHLEAKTTGDPARQSRAELCQNPESRMQFQAEKQNRQPSERGTGVGVPFPH